MINIQAIDVPLMISTDNGVTYKDLFCLTGYDVASDTTNTDINTFCGVGIGLGPVKTTYKGTAAVDISVNGGWNLQDILNWQFGRVLVNARSEYPGSGSAGADFYTEGQAYVTASDIKITVGDVVQFDFTFSVVGEITVVAP